MSPNENKPTLPNDQDEYPEPVEEFIKPTDVLSTTEVTRVIHLCDLPPEIQLYM